METLIFAKTLFFLSLSFVIILLGIFLAMIFMYLVLIARHLERVAGRLEESSDEVKERVSFFLEKLEEIPFLSYFFRKEPVKAEQEKEDSKKKAKRR